MKENELVKSSTSFFGGAKLVCFFDNNDKLLEYFSKMFE